MAATSSVSQANEDFDGILHDIKWASTSISYSFPTSASFYGVGYGLSNETDAGFEVMNATQIAVIENIFAELESFTNLDFTEITETALTHATLRFAMTDGTETAHAYTPNSLFEEGGDAWFRNDGTYDNPDIGNFAYVTFAHEIGHTLGLGHGHEDEGYGALASALDTEELSIMTYRDYVGDTLDGSENETWGNPQSFMMLDIAALQYMYGADYSAAGNVWSGDTVYTFSSTTGEMFINGVGQGTPGGNRVFRTIWDGHGTDTYDFSNYSSSVIIDLRPGEWSRTDISQLADLNAFASGFDARGNFANALLVNGDTRSLIENAIGGSSGNTFYGNQVSNILTGGGLIDEFYSSAGGDTFHGGGGFDTVNYSNETGDVTVDLVNGTTTGARNDSFTSIERATGGSGNDTLIGSSSQNRLYAGSGNDTIVGATGYDIYNGGGGVDTIDYTNITDDMIIRLNVGDIGTDYGNSRATAANNTVIFADTLWALENVTAGTGDDVISGSSADNLLQAGQGDDSLEGRAGNDTLEGGAGTDTAVFSVARSEYTLHTEYVGGEFVTTVTANSGTDGTDTLKEIETLQFSWDVFVDRKEFGLTGIQQNNNSNVDGDAYNELMFYNVNTNSSFFVDMGAGGMGANTYFNSSVLGWTPVGIGDMMGTGQAQVLYQNSTTGGLVGYGDNGLGGTGWTGYFPSLPANWTFEGVGDFTGDGFNDLMIKGPAGNLFYYDRDSVGVDTGWVYIGPTSNIWDPVDIGDFDKDGFSDVLAQDRSTGTTYFMNMDSGTFAGWGVVTPGAGPDWQAVAAADVNGDGYDDVIFHNQTTNQIWGVDMATKNWFAATHLSTDWTVAGTLDHDNDGYEDIIVRQTSTGYHVAIDMNEGAFSGFDLVSTALGDDWMLV